MPRYTAVVDTDVTAVDLVPLSRALRDYEATFARSERGTVQVTLDCHASTLAQSIHVAADAVAAATGHTPALVRVAAAPHHRSGRRGRQGA